MSNVSSNPDPFAPFSEGDRVRVVIEGVLGATSNVTGRRYINYVNHPGKGDRTAVLQPKAVQSVELLEPEYEAGKAYEDADGDHFIRGKHGGWIDIDGDSMGEHWPAKPLRRLA